MREVHHITRSHLELVYHRPAMRRSSCGHDGNITSQTVARTAVHDCREATQCEAHQAEKPRQATLPNSTV
eukprot:2674113-Pleurochrysis_carterae.AAC.2